MKYLVILVLCFTALNGSVSSEKPDKCRNNALTNIDYISRFMTELTYPDVPEYSHIRHYERNDLMVMTTFFYDGEYSSVVLWRGERVAVVERGVIVKLDDSRKWQCRIEKLVNRNQGAQAPLIRIVLA